MGITFCYYNATISLNLYIINDTIIDITNAWYLKEFKEGSLCNGDQNLRFKK